MESFFCPPCGSMLTIADSGEVRCTLCAFACFVTDLGALVKTSHSQPHRVADWLAEYRVESGEVAESTHVVTKGKGRAVVEEECPECHAPTMEFYTMQLRSADEGQTVFYECIKCGHKHSVNT